MRAARQNKMLRAAWLIRIAGHLDGTVVWSRLAFNETLRIKCACTTATVSHALGDAAAVGIHEPGEIEHFTKGNGSEVEVESGNENVVVALEQSFRELKEPIDKLAFVDR